jgi:hypothetical protein
MKSDWCGLQKNKIDSIIFESLEMESARDELHKLFRVLGSEYPPDTQIELRKQLSALRYKFGAENDAKLEIKTSIKADTFRKVISGKRSVSRGFLAMFVIGLRLPQEIAEELFCLQGYPLYEKNRFDFIVMCAIRDSDDISAFMKDAEKFDYKLL